MLCVRRCLPRGSYKNRQGCQELVYVLLAIWRRNTINIHSLLITTHVTQMSDLPKLLLI